MYGDLSREISESEIIEVAKSANIHDFIDSLPEVSWQIVHQHIILLDSLSSPV